MQELMDFFSTRITVGTDTSGIATAFNDPDASLKLAKLQQLQIWIWNTSYTTSTN